MTVVLWIVAVIVMLMRCLLGADFLVEQNEHFSETRGTVLDQEQLNDPSSQRKYHEEQKNYSKDRNVRPNEHVILLKNTE